MSAHALAAVGDGRRSAPLRSAPELADRELSLPAFDRDYWLGQCQGYRVDGSGGRIGFVDGVHRERGNTVLAVRAGRLGRRILQVPAENVAFIVPRAQRIWLAQPLTIAGSESCKEA
jgi:hypothetical protein